MYRIEKEREDDMRYMANFKGKYYHGGAKPKPLLVITMDWLAQYYNVTRMTLYRWIKDKKFNPSDIDSIVNWKSERLR